MSPEPLIVANNAFCFEMRNKVRKWMRTLSDWMIKAAVLAILLLVAGTCYVLHCGRMGIDPEYREQGLPRRLVELGYLPEGVAARHVFSTVSSELYRLENAEWSDATNALPIWRRADDRTSGFQGQDIVRMSGDPGLTNDCPSHFVPLYKVDPDAHFESMEWIETETGTYLSLHWL